MARLHIEFPEPSQFTTELTVRIGDVNFGGHLGHDAVVTLLHEARARFFADLGYSELEVAGVGIIMGDLGVVYRSEAHFQDRLLVEVAVADWTEKSCIFYYKMQHADGREVAIAQTSLVFYDYENRTVVPAPAEFRQAVEARSPAGS